MPKKVSQLFPASQRSSSPPQAMLQISMRVQLLAVLCHGLPSLPDFLEVSEDLLEWKKWKQEFAEYQFPTVQPPEKMLPTTDQLAALPPPEARARFNYYFAVGAILYFGTQVIGCAIFWCGGWDKRWKTLPTSEPATDGGDESSAPLLSIRVEKYLAGTVCALSMGACFAVVTFSLMTGRLSKRTGLDWELYMILFGASCLWSLVQAVLRVCIFREGLPPLFFVSSTLTILPIVGDSCDTLRDIIFGGLCFMSDNMWLKGLGILSWVHVVGLHVYFMVKGGRFTGFLAGSYLSVLSLPPVRVGEPKRMLMRLVFLQVTPTRRQMLVVEQIPQALFAIAPWLHQQKTGSPRFLCN